MRVAIIYRPKHAPPFELMPQLMQGMADWLGRYQDRMEITYFFVGGGGFGVVDMDDAADLQRMVSEHPFTPFAEIEIRPVLEPAAALQIVQEGFAATAASG